MDNLIPQCRRCHSTLHSMGKKRYETVYDVNLESLARYYGSRYREEHECPDESGDRRAAKEV